MNSHNKTQDELLAEKGDPQPLLQFVWRRITKGITNRSRFKLTVSPKRMRLFSLKALLALIS